VTPVSAAVSPRLLGAALLGLSVALSACRDDGKPVPVSPALDALLHEKADPKVALLIRNNLPSLFAALVVFRSDAFLTGSALLDRRNIPVLDAFGKAAILALNAPDVPFLLHEDEVKRVWYLARPEVLARIHPSLELEILRRFSEGRESEPLSVLARFRRPLAEAERAFLKAAGFHLEVEAGPVCLVTGPAAALPRLFEDDRIVFYEGASATRTMER